MACGSIETAISGPWLQDVYGWSVHATGYIGFVIFSGETVGTVFMVMGDILSGAMQLTGAVLLGAGLASGETTLVPKFGRLRPIPISSGWGIGYEGTI